MRATQNSIKSFGKTSSILPKGKKNVKKESEVLEEETKRMEEQLKQVQERVAKEREKDKTVAWTNATKEVPIRGYAKYVLEQKKMKIPGEGAGLGLKQKTVENRDVNKKIIKDAKGENVIGIKTQKIEASPPNEKQENPIVSKIAANFAKAKVDEDKKEYPEVDSFLEGINLMKYKDLFISNGFEDIESILELQEDHFEQMSIPLGHKLKMLKKIREIKGTTNEPAVPLLEITQKINCATEKKASEKKEETGIDNNSIAVGDYNEEENHKEFLEAREAWLNERKKASEAKKEQAEKPALSSQDQGTDCNFGEEKKANPAPSILFAAGGDAWNVNCLPEYADEGIGTTPRGNSTGKAETKKEKLCCYECFKMFHSKVMIEEPILKKVFCSKECLEKARAAIKINCGNANCSKEFAKHNGINAQGTWFCSEHCIRIDPLPDIASEERKNLDIERETEEMLKLEI